MQNILKQRHIERCAFLCWVYLENINHTTKYEIERYFAR